LRTCCYRWEHHHIVLPRSTGIHLLIARFKGKASQCESLRKRPESTDAHTTLLPAATLGCPTVPVSDSGSCKADSKQDGGYSRASSCESKMYCNQHGWFTVPSRPCCAAANEEVSVALPCCTHLCKCCAAYTLSSIPWPCSLTQAVTGHKAMLRHHAFWHEAHDDTHGAVHAPQAGPGFTLWQAKLDHLICLGALSTPAELLKVAVGLFKILGCWAMQDADHSQHSAMHMQGCQRASLCCHILLYTALHCWCVIRLDLAACAC